ncbi:MAG: hypothetical protein WC521_07685 [Bdellovibrionales bacterium]
MHPIAKLFIRVLSPRMVSKAVNSLDRSTAIVISICWSAALVTMILAVFAVHGAVSSRREATEVMSVEPVLPVISSVPMTPRELQSIADRLQRQFPDIKFEARLGQVLAVKTDDGLKFHQWITALSYIDTMAPQFRWTLKEFCTGNCGSGQGIMNAILSGQKMLLSPPHS